MAKLPNPRPRLTAYLRDQERQGLRQAQTLPNVVVGDVVPATTTGPVVGKARLTDADGTHLGWIAIYSFIT